jgi:Tol biopolymer transport system component
VVLIASSVVLMGGCVRHTEQETGRVIRVSVDSSGNEAAEGSSDPSVSADGRFVTFNSSAANMVAGNTGEHPDVFVHDLSTGRTERVSTAWSGLEANGWSGNASVSGNGRFVAFDSMATDMVPGDNNGACDVFVHDRVTKRTRRVAWCGPNSSGEPTISEYGRFVAFNSDAADLVPRDTNNQTDIFVCDQQAGIIGRASVDSSGAEGNNKSWHARISADGRFVAFTSDATNLVPDDRNSPWADVFVHDRDTGATERVSVSSSGREGDGGSVSSSISADGRLVAFRSDATTLVASDRNGKQDIFVHDRRTGVTERVSVNSSGDEVDGDSSDPAISGDGRFVAFASKATNLVDGDTNGHEDIFVHDRCTHKTARVNLGPSGSEADDFCFDVSISADGRFIAFSSDATNLVPGDTNYRVIDARLGLRAGVCDVFVARNPFVGFSGTPTATGPTIALKRSPSGD